MKSLREKNKDRKMNLDDKALKICNDFILTGLPRGDTLAVLNDILKWHEDTGFLTEGQRKLIKKIKADYDDYEYERELRDALVDLYNKDCTPGGAAGFIQDVSRYFDENNKFSPLQREQVIGIVDRAQEVLDEREQPE